MLSLPASNFFRPRRWIPALAAAAAFVSPVQASDLTYLRGLLAATPQGGWVQANTGSFSSAWATPEQGGLPPGSYSDPGAIVRAWSSVAWDSTRGDLLLWGGGHANYLGNEMYVWHGATGTWTRGSLPTRMESYGTSSTYFTVDNITPQSAHTYDNNLYAPINDRFVTFGGAAFNSGGSFVSKGPSGAPVSAGPWLWDPGKADASKVGGADGSGYLAATTGGRMWSNERGNWVGNGDGPSHIETSSAYRTENGKDVIYVTSDSHASGFQKLYRYELGDVSTGQPGVFQQVGVSYYAAAYQNAATIDTVHNLYVHTSAVGTEWQGLGVWNLSKLPTGADGVTVDCIFTFSEQSDRCLFDRYIKLVDGTGAPFAVNQQHGIAFDQRASKIYLWDGKDRGTVWATEAEYLADGSLDPIWTVNKLTSSTTAQPRGNFGNEFYETGVLGKWQYVTELGAFIALDEYDDAKLDAGVWLYKPFVTMFQPSAAVPEPGTLGLLSAGLSVIGGLSARRRRG